MIDKKITPRKMPFILAVFAFVFALTGCDNQPVVNIPTFTVAFTSASGTVVAPQTVPEGGTATEPATPTKAWFPAAGLWVGTLPAGYVFGGWRHEDEPWTFATDTVTEDITLTAYWTAPVATRVETVEANNVVAAVAYVNANPGAFTLAVSGDVPSGHNTLTAEDADLTVVGIGSDAVIRLTEQSRLLSVGHATSGQTSNARLTLRNITLEGREQASDLVRVWNGGRLYMDTGTTITGHTNTFSGISGGVGAAVNVGTGGTFTMRGGTITGNRAAHADGNTYLSGGVFVNNESSRFYMKGGSITGNTRVLGYHPGAADVFILTDVIYFTLSGDAQIHSLILNSGTAANVSITIGSGGWSGSVSNLYLRSGNPLATTFANWLNRTVLQAAGNQTVTNADVERIASMRFIVGNTETPPPRVDDIHKIVIENNTGVLRRSIPAAFLQVSAGQQHTAAIAADGTLWAWGYQADGRLGNGLTTGYLVYPVRIGSETNWVQVSAGTGHTLAVRADGTLWGWGTGNNGRLGHGGILPDGTVGSETGNRGGGPARIGTETNWVYVSTVNQSTMGLRADGTLWGWGAGGQGRLGVGTTAQQNAPAQVTYPAETGWVRLSMSTQHGLAIRADGSLWAWGNNGSNRLGLGGGGNQINPVRVGPEGTVWVHVAAGYTHNLAIRADGTLWAWGNFNYGRLGIGDVAENQTVPVQVGTATDWVYVSAGNCAVPVGTGQGHSLGIRQDASGNRTLWAWGSREYGKLGDGATTGYQTTPVQVGTATDWQSVYASRQHSAGIRANGSLWTWGLNAQGRTGHQPTAEDTTAPVQVGGSR